VTYKAEPGKDHNTGGCNQQKGCEHPRDIQPITSLKNTKRKARFDTASACHVFGNNSPD
jgi:hypothetical protein